MSWLYEGREFVYDEKCADQFVGFVYLICNQSNKRSYVGKKLFTSARRYQKNNKKRTKRVLSDWIEYTGSNIELNQDVAKGDIITKTILHLCTSKGWMSYYETKEILNRDALLNDDYYNSWVSCKIKKEHLK